MHGGYLNMLLNQVNQVMMTIQGDDPSKDNITVPQIEGSSAYLKHFIHASDIDLLLICTLM